MQGPANFMVQRMQREDPSIRTDRPIPMSKLKEAMEKMRASRGGGDSDRDDGRGGDDDDDDALVVGVLVPGFGGVELPPLVPGFGAAAELLAVRVTDADLREAEESLRRYDRNKDGFIGADEISRRWDGNPVDFDQNRDNKLSPSELAVRVARRRVNRAEEETRRADRGRRRDEGDRGEEEVEDRFGGRLSYRPPSDAAPEGLPGWFSDKDRDGDGQVMMNEYERSWSDDKVEEFFSFDLNRDGVITAQEALRAVKQGASSAPSSSASMASSSREESSRSGSRSRSRSDDDASSSSSPGTSGEVDPKYVQYAERILSRSDKDGNKVLTVDEWKTMIMDISPADADRDGKITVGEYAGWLHARANQ
ncbi:EF-hand domain-containing protein [Candidatus Laterigemmans baculatus]|uniref:EF-hand domain-containing protein n=1 Tax=Candidatus Laterigemmans baculatus TaxID=2770505 RepID=UPI001F40B84C|nr:EF-hand domain-containing protein [Candidatus Laterigemmans baculatus]